MKTIVMPLTNRFKVFEPKANGIFFPIRLIEQHQIIVNENFICHAMNGLNFSVSSNTSIIVEYLNHGLCHVEQIVVMIDTDTVA